MAPGPGGPLLLEDALDLWAWLGALRRTMPPARWVEEWASEASYRSMEALL
jgi:hypothetical protein